MNLGFLSALGDAYTGYGKDQDIRVQRQRQASLDQNALTFQQAQINNWNSERDNQSRSLAQQGQYQQAQIAQQQAEQALRDREQARIAANRQTVQTNWGAASKGDRAAQSAVVGADSSLANYFAPKEKIPTPPTQDWVATSATDPSGAPYLLNAHTGEMRLGSGQLAKGGGGNMGNANAQMQALRLASATREAVSADQRMRGVEDDIKSGKVDIGAMNSMLGMLSNDVNQGHGVMSAGTQAAAAKLLQYRSPELYQYYSDALSLAEAESLVAQRPSDFRTKLAERLSAARGSPGGANIDAIAQRRAGIVQSLMESAVRQGIPIQQLGVQSGPSAGVDNSTTMAMSNPMAKGGNSMSGGPGTVSFKGPQSFSMQKQGPRASLTDRIAQLKAAQVPMDQAKQVLINEGYQIPPDA